MARHVPELLTLHQAAERLNVHYMTAYRWVRKGELPAYKTGGRLRVRLADVERFLTERRLDVAMSIVSTNQTDWDRHVDRLVAHLLAGDDRSAHADVQKVISDGATAGNAYVRLITPALHRVGTAWEHGEITVAEEHRASQICVSIVAQLSDMFRRSGAPRGTAVTLTPPDERHALASAMVADFLRGAGFTVHHLGSGVPASDLAIFLKVVPADLICFSITQSIPIEEYHELMRACQEANPETAVIFGGQGVDEEAATAVGATVLVDMAGLAVHIEQL
ncbi:MAG TPA: helix-turn-helix domain-containing protein [Euzebyales bacterium]|nr:helix-turn-helix domain-containing protein [Euzebyales bacterium]